MAVGGVGLAVKTVIDTQSGHGCGWCRAGREARH